jgi:quinol monooxygenase YgiN
MGKSAGRSKSEVVICTYRIKRRREAAFLKILSRHWPTLRRLGLATRQPATVYRGADKSKKTFFIEIFTWKSGEAMEAAHQSPEVMAVWEAMGKHMEERLGRPAMEFPHVEPVHLKFAKA